MYLPGARRREMSSWSKKRQEESSDSMSARSVNKVSIVVFSQELDKACAAFTIANAAAASGMEVTMFFSCWGVNVVRRKGSSLSGDDLTSRIMSLLSPGGATRLPLSRLNFFGWGS